MTPDPKKSALRLARVAADKLAEAEHNRDNAIRFAVDSGASLREVAEAVGVSHMTVKNIVSRGP
jgi:transposase